MAHAFGLIGIIVGPVMAGYIFDVTNSYQVAFIICASMAFISLVSSASLSLSKGKKVIK
jgi:MFS family permease